MLNSLKNIFKQSENETHELTNNNFTLHIIDSFNLKLDNYSTCILTESTYTLFLNSLSVFKSVQFLYTFV